MSMRSRYLSGEIMRDGLEGFEEHLLEWLSSVLPDVPVDDSLENDQGDAYTLGQMRGYAEALGMTVSELVSELGADTELTARELLATNMGRKT